MSDHTDALERRKETLTTQLRQLDEARDTANGDRDREDGDLTVRADSDGHVVLVDGEWWTFDEAESLTRAGLHEVDTELGAAGVL